MNNFDNISNYLGKILSNLLSLELVLRVFLDCTENNSRNTQVNLEQILNSNIGDSIPENQFTNYDTLGNLIYKFNNRLKEKKINESIDISVVDLRDALAHGRIISNHENGPYKILKFSRPKNGLVELTISENISSDWFKKKNDQIISEYFRVIEIGRRIGLQCFSVKE